MPGSRPAEITKNFPILPGGLVRLSSEFPWLGGCGATKPVVESRLHEIAGELRSRPPGRRT